MLLYFFLSCCSLVCLALNRTTASGRTQLVAKLCSPRGAVPTDFTLGSVASSLGLIGYRRAVNTSHAEASYVHIFLVDCACANPLEDSSSATASSQERFECHYIYENNSSKKLIATVSVFNVTELTCCVASSGQCSSSGTTGFGCDVNSTPDSTPDSNDDNNEYTCNDGDLIAIAIKREERGDNHEYTKLTPNLVHSDTSEVFQIHTSAEDGLLSIYKVHVDARYVKLHGYFAIVPGRRQQSSYRCSVRSENGRCQKTLTYVPGQPAVCKVATERPTAGAREDGQEEEEEAEAVDTWHLVLVVLCVLLFAALIVVSCMCNRGKCPQRQARPTRPASGPGQPEEETELRQNKENDQRDSDRESSNLGGENNV